MNARQVHGIVRPKNAVHTALRIVLFAILGLFALYYLLPFIVMVITALKPLEEIRGGNLISLPRNPTLEPTLRAWDSACVGVRCEGLKQYMWNSVAMVVPAVLFSTMLGAINGYALTKWRFRGADLIFGLMLFGAFIPFQVVLLPMAPPAFVVTVIWQFTQIWNDFLFGIAFTAGDSNPATVALNNLVASSTGVKEYNVDMAAAIIAAIPTLIVYVFAGKYFVRGLAAGALKG